MTQDPQVRDRAVGILEGLFHHVGSGGTQPVPGGVNLGGMAVQLEQFFNMPMELASIFLTMATDLTQMILTSLEQAGIVLVEGLTPL
jgi:hypothetical protein